MKSLILIAGAATMAMGGVSKAQQPVHAQAAQSIKRSDVIAKLDANFAADDTNHDGVLSLAEMEATQNRELQSLRNALLAKLRTTFNQLDTNHDGQLSFAEFAAQAAAVKPNETAQQVLQKLDTNHDGKISAAEWRAPHLAQFDHVDANHDGIVTADELRRAQGQH